MTHVRKGNVARARRREAANERTDARAERTPSQQIDTLVARGVYSGREIARLRASK